MSQTEANPVPAYPTAKTSKPLRVFTAGNYGDGDNWTLDALRKVVENWARFQKPKDPAWAEPPVIFLDPKATDGIAGKPDVGIGHEADQAYLRWLLDRTDRPSAGWPTDLWLEGDALFADLDGMPEEVASLVNGGLLKYCSAEFHRDFTTLGGEHYGPALRRISLIGGEPPRSKGNGAIPPMIYSEKPTPGVTSRLPLISCFSEGQTMDRAAMLASLKECGYDVTKITDAVPDEALAEMVRASQALKASQIPVSANAEDPNKPTPPNPNGSQFAGSNENPATFSERQVEAMIQRATAPLSHQIATLNSQLVGMNGQVQKVTGTLATRDRATERGEVASFCERLLTAKKIEPAELDARLGPTLIDRILALDNGSVATFGEKQLTPRAAYMAQLEAKSPIRTFTEKMADPLGSQQVSEARRRELLNGSRVGQVVLRREAAAARK